MVSEADYPSLDSMVICDASKCPAQALALAANSKKHVLAFCMHHSNEFEASLLGQGFFVVEDKRELANAGR